MTRSHLLVAVAAAVLAFPLSALAADADPALDAFRTLCADTGADFPAVVKAAAADGWTDAEVMADDLPGVSVTDKAARSKGKGTDEITLRATRGLRTVKTGDITVSTCTVRGDNSPPGLLDRVQAWLNMAAMSTDKDSGKASYLLTYDGKTRTVLAQADIDAAVGKGGAHLLKFKQDGTSEILDYERFSK
jgi:hypothetical protein